MSASAASNGGEKPISGRPAARTSSIAAHARLADAAPAFRDDILDEPA